MIGSDNVASIEQATPSLVEIANGYLVSVVVPKDRTVTSIGFYKDTSNYVATVSLDSIAIFDAEDNSPIAKHDRITGDTFWYLNSGKTIPDVIQNQRTLKKKGREYSKELSEVLTKGISDYISRFHAFCKK